MTDESIPRTSRVPDLPGLRRPGSAFARAIRAGASALREPKDLEPLIEEIAESRIVMLGESSHGTHEFYDWRRLISEWLIARHGFDFIAVEGDWPACAQANRFIRGNGRGGASGEDPRQALQGFRRWPTWMWANLEIVRMVEWLRTRNQEVTPRHPIGFYGLDVYSLFESMDEAVTQLARIDPFLAKRMGERYACFDVFRRDERAYAKSLARVPEGCANQVVRNLQELLAARMAPGSEEARFEIEQNARVAANAEHYYRAMIHADEDSWNVRDRHMLETLENLLDHHEGRLGRPAKAIVWAHNTHVGDYRATDMLRAGQINLGGLARERWGESEVSLVGFGTYEGKVTASRAWDGPTRTIALPPAQAGSWDAYFHEAAESLRENALFISLRSSTERTTLSHVRGHRALGVVYRPEHERLANYVPTSLARRYDAFVFIDQTRALDPIGVHVDRAHIPETWPRGQ